MFFQTDLIQDLKDYLFDLMIHDGELVLVMMQLQGLQRVAEGSHQGLDLTLLVLQLFLVLSPVVLQGTGDPLEEESILIWNTFNPSDIEALG